MDGRILVASFSLRSDLTCRARRDDDDTGTLSGQQQLLFIRAITPPRQTAITSTPQLASYLHPHPPSVYQPSLVTMSSRAPVELDFLGLRAAAAADDEHHNKNSSSVSCSSSSSIRGMETRAIARIDPQLLRRVIARPPPPAAAEETTAPMTLFYNGSVAIFDVSHDKAKAIMRMATEVTTPEGRVNGNTLVGNFAKDMPLARTESLHRFLQKRKERLTRLCPYQLGGAAATVAVGATTTTTSKSFHVKKEAEAA